MTAESEECLAALPGLEETRDRFQDVGLEERLVEEILEGGRGSMISE